LLIENKALLNVGFKTGDKIVSVDEEKIVKFDNDDHESDHGQRSSNCTKWNGTTIKMPNDFC
jgi:regulator of sigma E protease